jgi:heme-degrading monooxygenase HmoA
VADEVPGGGNDGRIVMLYATTLRSDALRDEYDAMNAEARAVAERTPGFIAWTEYAGPTGERLGVVEFESEDTLAAWRDDPSHTEASRRGREAVFGRYRVQICRVVRESSFDVADHSGT